MFHLESGGCNTSHPTPFYSNRPQGLPVHLLLILKKHTQMEINGKIFEAPPYSAILIKKNTPHRYYKTEGEYSNHWIHFDCPFEDENMLDTFLPNGQLFSLRNPEIITTYIHQLLWENIYTDEQYRAIHVDSLFRILFQHLSADFYDNTNIKYNPYLSKIQDLHIKMLSAPHMDYNIEEICKEIGISTSYFQYVYKDYFGLSFRNSLIQLRIEHAKSLLRDNNITITEVAQRCGYTNDVHFYRQFKKTTGVTPNGYRKIIDTLLHYN